MTTITLCVFAAKWHCWKGSKKANGHSEGKTFQFLASIGKFKKRRLPSFQGEGRVRLLEAVSLSTFLVSLLEGQA